MRAVAAQMAAKFASRHLTGKIERTMRATLPTLAWMLVLAALAAPAALAQNQNAVSPGYFPGKGLNGQPLYGTYYGGYGGYGRNGYGGYGGYGFGGYGYRGGGIGSIVGNYLGGISSIIRSEGQASLSASQANINNQSATSQAIKNDVDWTKAYIEMRHLRKAWHDENQPAPLTPEAWTRLAHAGVPKRLPATAIDSVTGAISWPNLLMADEFSADREKIQKLFVERAKTHGAIGPDSYGRIRRAVDQAMDHLKPFIAEVPSREYNQARNFLDSLGFEASFAPG